MRDGRAHPRGIILPVFSVILVASIVLIGNAASIVFVPIALSLALRQ